MRLFTNKYYLSLELSLRDNILFVFVSTADKPTVDEDKPTVDEDFNRGRPVKYISN